VPVLGSSMARFFKRLFTLLWVWFKPLPREQFRHSAAGAMFGGLMDGPCPHMSVNELLPVKEVFENGPVAVLCCRSCRLGESPPCGRVREFGGEKVVSQEGVELSVYLAECAHIS
jgi:hypothetical protein